MDWMGVDDLFRAKKPLWSPQNWTNHVIHVNIPWRKIWIQLDLTNEKNNYGCRML